MAAALLHSASLARPNVASQVAAQPATSALALVPARRKQGATQRTSVRSQSAFETVSMVSQVATTAAVCIGAYMLLQQSSGPLPEQDNYDNSERSCPMCSGTGFEPCLCNRWSDGDVGCNGCNKTGYMRCRGCGGGGRAMPLFAKIKVPKRQAYKK